MKKINILTIIVTLSLFLINNLYAYSNIIPSNTKKECTIINVDDGDTFDLLCNNIRINNVRTLGVNAPDLKINGKNTYKHCYYDESKNIIEILKKKKRNLIIEFYGKDLCKDPSKGCRNLVRIIDKKSGLDINELLITKGYNFSWVKFSMIPKNLQIKYFIAEKRAKRYKKGLWGKCEILYNDQYNYFNSNFPNKMTN